MNQKEKALRERLISEVVPHATEGLVLRVRKNGRIVADLSVGKTYRYYDLASLTKIVFTNTALMMLCESGRLSLNEHVQEVLPWFQHRNIIIRSLLNHTAGLTWWKPIYKKVPLKKSVNERWEVLKNILNSEKPRGTGRAVYSDLDYFLLAFILERKWERPLESIWTQVQDQLQLSNLHFNVANRPLFSRKFYAPTEDCPWRKKILRGEVHDDNTWALGGVSSHAGLFGSLDGVDDWFEKMRKSFRGKGPLDKAVLRKFWTRSLPSRRGDWALGYMMPSPESSAGRYFSKYSVGHTGFTGTSLWYDPQSDFSVILLSNRVHPTRNHATFVKKRPLIHDWCWELFNES